MITNTFTTTIIEAEGDNYLTQVAEVELKDRLVAAKIALGKFDSVDNYKEISKEEGDAIKAEQENLMSEEEE